MPSRFLDICESGVVDSGPKGSWALSARTQSTRRASPQPRLFGRRRVRRPPPRSLRLHALARTACRAHGERLASAPRGRSRRAAVPRAKALMMSSTSTSTSRLLVRFMTVNASVPNQNASVRAGRPHGVKSEAIAPNSSAVNAGACHREQSRPPRQYLAKGLRERPYGRSSSWSRGDNRSRRRRRDQRATRGDRRAPHHRRHGFLALSLALSRAST
jgi:hypothetical protein